MISLFKIILLQHNIIIIKRTWYKMYLFTDSLWNKKWNKLGIEKKLKFHEFQFMFYKNIYYMIILKKLLETRSICRRFLKKKTTIRLKTTDNIALRQTKIIGKIFLEGQVLWVLWTTSSTTPLSNIHQHPIYKQQNIFANWVLKACPYWM